MCAHMRDVRYHFLAELPWMSDLSFPICEVKLRIILTFYGHGTLKKPDSSGAPCACVQFGQVVRICFSNSFHPVAFLPVLGESSGCATRRLAAVSDRH